MCSYLQQDVRGNFERAHSQQLHLLGKVVTLSHSADRVDWPPSITAFIHMHAGALALHQSLRVPPTLSHPQCQLLIAWTATHRPNSQRGLNKASRTVTACAEVLKTDSRSSTLGLHAHSRQNCCYTLSGD